MGNDNVVSISERVDLKLCVVLQTTIAQAKNCLICVRDVGNNVSTAMFSLDNQMWSLVADSLRVVFATGGIGGELANGKMLLARKGPLHPKQSGTRACGGDWVKHC